MKVLSNIEESFNDIWQVKKSRSLVRKFSDYFSIMLLSPILVIVSGSLTVYITTNIVELTESIELLGFFSPLIHFGMRLLPILIIAIVFTLLYMVMPNTKVDIVAAIIAGFIAALAFQMVEWVYITFQIGVSKFNAIYGSFAALPLFLIWLQTSWVIVIFGAELAFANQNVNKYEYESESLSISHEYRLKLSLLLVYTISKRFEAAEKPYNVDELGLKLGIPQRILRQLLYELTEGGILSELNPEKENPTCYQPARDIHGITYRNIREVIEKLGLNDIPSVNKREFAIIEETLKQFQQKQEQNSAKLHILDIGKNT
jgi:membrane protein